MEQDAARLHAGQIARKGRAGYGHGTSTLPELRIFFGFHLVASSGAQRLKAEGKLDWSRITSSFLAERHPRVANAQEAQAVCHHGNIHRCSVLNRHSLALDNYHPWPLFACLPT